MRFRIYFYFCRAIFLRQKRRKKKKRNNRSTYRTKKMCRS